MASQKIKRSGCDPETSLLNISIILALSCCALMMVWWVLSINRGRASFFLLHLKWLISANRIGLSRIPSLSSDPILTGFQVRHRFSFHLFSFRMTTATLNATTPTYNMSIDQYQYHYQVFLLHFFCIFFTYVISGPFIYYEFNRPWPAWPSSGTHILTTKTNANNNMLMMPIS